MTPTTLVLICALIVCFCHSFSSAYLLGTKRGYHHSSCHHRRFQLSAKGSKAGGKGFGAPKAEPVVTVEPVVEDDESKDEETLATTQPEEDTSNKAEMSPEEMILNTKMFQNKISVQKETLQDKIRRVQEEEDLIATDASVGAVPEIVADRMLGRIVAFFGVPVFGGLAIFVGAFFYSKKYDMVVPPNLIAYATQLPFVLGLMGISYAILSTSWDPEVIGTITHLSITARPIPILFSLLSLSSD
jgi:hypothetical protein